jgi:hypothetical protein
MTLSAPPSHATPITPPKGGVLVHGRNKALSDAMFEFLRAIDLKPIEWDRAVELTEEAAPYIGQLLDTAFDHAQAVVVLMTPDEIAYLQRVDRRLPLRHSALGDEPLNGAMIGPTGSPSSRARNSASTHC